MVPGDRLALLLNNVPALFFFEFVVDFAIPLIGFVFAVLAFEFLGSTPDPARPAPHGIT